jgi:hypothetical protein
LSVFCCALISDCYYTSCTLTVPCCARILEYLAATTLLSAVPMSAVLAYANTLCVLLLLGSIRRLPCSRIWLPPHSLHLGRILLCSHIWLPLHSLQLVCILLCSQILLEYHHRTLCIGKAACHVGMFSVASSFADACLSRVPYSSTCSCCLFSSD